LVDKDCLVNKCSLQAKACLQDDPECRKGLTCTAKCLGDNACITGCFARYGTPNLDGLLKCTIEDNECIKVAILEGGADKLGEEPRSPAPTVQRFDLASMEGTWYKVAGYNPNYDCYACQRNTFSAPEGGWVDGMNDKLANNPNSNVRVPTGGLLGSALGNMGADRLQVDVEFSMPRMLPDGSPPPPSGVRESFDGESGLQSVGYNQYSTHETMVFDNVNAGLGEKAMDLMLGKKGEEKLYSRTAHSEGEMFVLKFWENWYIIGQNDPGQDEFKFIYYNGKTRQNTYDGAFIYSRSRSLSPSSMEKVYQIAKDAGMNPDQFCKIQNGCFDGVDEQKPSYVEREGLGSPTNPFRGILASTKVSEILGVESVAAESNIPRVPTTSIANDFLGNAPANINDGRPWWKEVGDYLEDPRRHFRLMDSLRTDMDWPEYIKNAN
jgi:lipocalin